MKHKIIAILPLMIAAFLISGAAICTMAQSIQHRKENARENPSDPASPPKQESPASPMQGPNGTGKSSPSTSAAKAQTKSAQYSYEFTQPAFLINYVSIEHDGDGSGKITFERRNSDPIVDPLDLSPATVERIRKLWDNLHFLDSEISYQTVKQFPHLGTVRLHMKQDTRDRVAEFNWTSDRDAFALVTEYRRIANQAIFIFDITVAREIQPLEAPKLMDQFDAYLRRGEIADAKQLIPLFRDLSTDERIPLMARNSAARILKKIDK